MHTANSSRPFLCLWQSCAERETLEKAVRPAPHSLNLIRILADALHADSHCEADAADDAVVMTSIAIVVLVVVAVCIPPSHSLCSTPSGSLSLSHSPLPAHWAYRACVRVSVSAQTQINLSAVNCSHLSSLYVVHVHWRSQALTTGSCTQNETRVFWLPVSLSNFDFRRRRRRQFHQLERQSSYIGSLSQSVSQSCCLIHFHITCALAMQLLL